MDDEAPYGVGGAGTMRAQGTTQSSWIAAARHLAASTLARPMAIAAALVASAILIPGGPSLAAPILYFVDSTGDGGNVGPVMTCDDGTGHCTLRAAMEAANANPGEDSIFISIDPTTDPNCDAATGRCTISLTTPLPEIS